MNRSLLKRVIAGSVAWTAMALLCGVVALAQDAAPAGGQRTDGQIEMDVVHALDQSAALKNDLITAATIQGQVTLAGTVSSEDSKKLAESIVKGVPGVTGVKNNLNIGNPANDPNAEGAQNAQNDDTQEMADNGQPAPPPSAAPAPDYGQNSGSQSNQQTPQYGQQQPQYGQPAPPPAYGQVAPPPPPGYGQRPQYNSPYGPGPGYAPAAPAPPYKYAKGPVTIPQGTMIQLRTSEPVDSKRAKGGEPVQFTVIQDVTYGGVLAIPRGATVHGVIADSKNVGSGTLEAARSWPCS